MVPVRAKERTLVLIKPDAVEKMARLPIIQEYLNYGLEIEKVKTLKMSEELAKEFYKDHDGKPYFSGLIQHTISGPIVALVISGKEAIRRVRELNGATNPANARKGTVRQLYGEPNGGPRNAVHSSDLPQSAEREIRLIFGEIS